MFRWFGLVRWFWMGSWPFCWWQWDFVGYWYVANLFFFFLCLHPCSFCLSLVVFVLRCYFALQVPVTSMLCQGHIPMAWLQWCRWLWDEIWFWCVILLFFLIPCSFLCCFSSTNSMPLRVSLPGWLGTKSSQFGFHCDAFLWFWCDSHSLARLLQAFWCSVLEAFGHCHRA